MGPTFSHGDLKEMICERLSFSQLKSSQLKSTSQVYTETTDYRLTIRKPIECAPEASRT